MSEESGCDQGKFSRTFPSVRVETPFDRSGRQSEPKSTEEAKRSPLAKLTEMTHPARPHQQKQPPTSASQPTRPQQALGQLTRLRHLIVHLPERGSHLVRQRSGHDHDVGLTWRCSEDDAETVLVVPCGGHVPGGRMRVRFRELADDLLWWEGGEKTESALWRLRRGHDVPILRTSVRQAERRS
jgi:hypothetical protein